MRRKVTTKDFLDAMDHIWGKPVVKTTPLTKRTIRKIYSLSDVPIKRVSRRDREWLNWIDKHGASDSSIRKFLAAHPPK